LYYQSGPRFSAAVEMKMNENIQWQGPMACHTISKQSFLFLADCPFNYIFVKLRQEVLKRMDELVKKWIQDISLQKVKLC
jgi:hypothetical protein